MYSTDSQYGPNKSIINLLKMLPDKQLCFKSTKDIITKGKHNLSIKSTTKLADCASSAELKHWSCSS